MIPIKVNNNNPNFSQKLSEYNNFIDSNDFSKLICPLCNVIGQFERNTSYIRNYTYIEEECFENFENNIKNIVDTHIKITVIRCNACKKYHALLPTFILPYHIYSAYFIMLALFLKFFKHKSIETILNSLNISHKLFYYWVFVFKTYLPHASIVLKSNNDPPEVLKLIVCDFESFLSNFYNHYFHMFFLNTCNHTFS